MKKGLLSLLAAALTIVSCQNYDDQFAELTGLVNTLSTTVAGIAEVKTEISTLSQTVTGLKASLDSSIPGLSTSLDTAIADIATLEGLLADVATDDDLDDIIEALGLVQADVTTLLEADVVINQNITINNAATFEYVSTLIAHGPDDPSVIVNGRVTIATALLTPSELTSTSLIASKLRTVLGNSTAAGAGVTITSTQVLDLSNLAFVDDDVVITGGKQNIAGLKTISGNFTLDYGKLAETLNLSGFTSIGGDINIATTTANSATAVDFGMVDVSGYVQTGTAASKTNSFPNALTINTSNAGYIGMDADKATSIESSMDGVTPVVASMTIGATGGGTIDMNSLTAVTGAFSLTGTTTTVAHFDKLESATTVDVVSSSEAHLGLLATHTTIAAVGSAALDFSGITATGGLTSLVAPVVNVSSLVSITHATTLDSVGLSATKVASVTAILISNKGHINLPKAQFSGAAALLTTTATKVTVGGSQGAILGKVLQGTAPNIDDLTVTDQRSSLTAITNTVLDKLSITTADNGALTYVQTNANTVKELTLSGFDTATIGANGATTALVTVTTAGTMKSLTLVDNDSLVSLNIGHTYSTSYTDAQLISLIGHANLTAVDLASVVRLENAIIIGNAKLATILAPASTNLLTPGATLNYRVYANKVSVTYTLAVAAVQDGINNTPYVQAKIANPSLASWKRYLTAVSSVNSIVGKYSFTFSGESTAAAYVAHTLGTGSTLLAPAAPYVASAANGFETNAALDVANTYAFSIFKTDGTAGDGTRLTDAATTGENLLTWVGEIDTLRELSACE